jgi:rRNA-processing protein FCF1
VSVLLDANALLVPVQFGIDIFEEIGRIVGGFEPLTLDSVLEELDRLSRGKGRDAIAARVGRSLCERCRVLKTSAPAVPVDEQLVLYAKEHGCIVVTNDRQLRTTLLEQGIDVITLRKQKKLELLKA